MILNCVNCGAPTERGKEACPYCKTPYDVSGFNAEIGEMFGELTIGGRTCKVYLGNVEHHKISEVAYRSADGILHNGNVKIHRTFTLIEV